jgi:hypothetical protein
MRLPGFLQLIGGNQLILDAFNNACSGVNDPSAWSFPPWPNAGTAINRIAVINIKTVPVFLNAFFLYIVEFIITSI